MPTPMQTRTFDALVASTKLQVSSCPDGVLEEKLRLAYHTFVKETLCLKRDFWVDLQACVQDYDVRVPDGHELHMVSSVCVCDRKLVPTRDDLCDTHYGDWFKFEAPKTIIIGRPPIEDVPDGMVVRGNVVPKQDSAVMDERVYNLHADAIRTGALSFLFIMKGTEWYDTMQGGIHLQRWKRAIASARIEKFKGGISGPMKAKAKRFV